MTEAERAVQTLRLKLKAARALLRDLSIAAAQAEEALQAMNAQPKEAQRDHDHLAA